MKRTLIFIYHVVFCISVSAQSNTSRAITGRVFDKESGKHVSNAVIKKVGTDVQTATNALGFFQVEFKDSSRFEVTSPGYIPQVIEIHTASNFKVELIRYKEFRPVTVLHGPSFPGGMEAFFNYIHKNMSIPPSAPKGMIKVQMYIAADGSVIKDSVRIIQSLCAECDRQALKVVKKSPKWNPSDQPDIPVIIPIVIR